MNSQRPAALNGAIVLLALGGVTGALAALLPDEGPDPGVVVTYGGPLLVALALVAAFGLWRLKTWGMLLAIVVSALSAFLGLGGAIFATSPLIKALGVAMLVSGALVIALVSLPSARQAYAAERARAVRARAAQ